MRKMISGWVALYLLVLIIGGTIATKVKTTWTKLESLAGFNKG